MMVVTVNNICLTEKTYRQKQAKNGKKYFNLNHKLIKYKICSKMQA